MSDDIDVAPDDGPSDEEYQHAVQRSVDARRHLVTIVADLSWLCGAAEQAGVIPPAPITDHLTAAVAWLGGDT